jgi:hypothetical protein
MFGDEDFLIGFVFEDDRVAGNSEAIANAHLIAAAPDMYEALQEQCHHCHTQGEEPEICKKCQTGKALAKATE